ncbi:unnamed protein product [Pseudo-nitzschia multistriata]|uniref:Uncharacterized protein n=1 Tax=Pseudo-nitzschia multistriata TaxID=183589 RepID=A0A448ZKB2_9STRA|nr:unnamed protein product [Pseudo-nitzschia multistriata]
MRIHIVRYNDIVSVSQVALQGLRKFFKIGLHSRFMITRKGVGVAIDLKLGVNSHVHVHSGRLYPSHKVNVIIQCQLLGYLEQSFLDSRGGSFWWPNMYDHPGARTWICFFGEIFEGVPGGSLGGSLVRTRGLRSARLLIGSSMSVLYSTVGSC